MELKKLSDRERAAVDAIAAKEKPIQDQLDVLNADLQEAMQAVNTIRDQIRTLKPELVPLAEMKAAVASFNSRNKYFPEFAGRPGDQSKQDALLDFVESTLK